MKKILKGPGDEGKVGAAQAPPRTEAMLHTQTRSLQDRAARSTASHAQGSPGPRLAGGGAGRELETSTRTQTQELRRAHAAGRRAGLALTAVQK